MNSIRTRTALLTLAMFCLILSLLSAPLLANDENRPDEPLVEIDYSSTKIAWYPRQSLGHSELVVSAPDGNIYQRYFEPGEPLKFSIFDPEFELCDGNYSWEVRFMERELVVRKVKDTEPVALTGKRTFGAFITGGNIGLKNGKLVDPSLTDNKEGGLVDQDPGSLARPKDFVILDDLIVDGSACVGFDCVNGESFGFDTLRLKENNLRIKFQDTSGGSFPTADWQLTANASASGGANKFSIDDIDNGRTPFTVEARAPSHSLYVDDGGRVGFGTSVPVVDLHVVSGNSPTLRLEQNGSSGFAPQTWDLAGNETNFFIRDASNGSTLPFRIRPGASSNVIYINSDNNVGFGTTSPDASIEVSRTDGSAQILVTEGSGSTAERTLFQATNNGKARFTLARTDLAAPAGADWSFAHGGNNFEITKTGTGVQELTLNSSTGDLTIMGDFVSNGTALDVPDYVFADDYPLMPLDQLAAFIETESHLPNVPSAKEINGGTLNITQMQMKLLEKVEELTLYTLDQQRLIEELRREVETLRQNDSGD